MQLIEIVQIALLLFIVASAIIFLFSYLGYRTKSKANDLPKVSTNLKNEIIQPKIVEKQNPILEQDKPKDQIKKNPRFEVFIPENDGKIDSEKFRSKKSHFPKTLTIKHKS
ncbi:MAG: hypothetical protein IPJ23_07745 [Ignavibacteriales bacterium]|nr:hypothetical protein [Ignavibacteriales bacterium]